MARYMFETYPYVNQTGYIEIPDDYEGSKEEYIQEHWDDVELSEPEFDYAGTALDAIEECTDYKEGIEQ